MRKRLKGLIRQFIITGLLVVTQLMIWLVPFSELVKLMGLSDRASSEQVNQLTMEKAGYIGRAVSYAAHRLPIKCRCLTQALTAIMLLNRLQISSTLCLGLRKDGRSMEAHAWLMVGQTCILGQEESAGFNQIACYTS